MNDFSKEKFEKKMQLISFMHYLGYFKTKLKPEEIEKFKKDFDVKKTYLVYGEPEKLKKIGCYFLCAMGRPTYRMVNFSKAVDTIFKGDYEEAEGIRENSLELFILYINQGTPNISNEQYITPIMDSRHQKELPTLILSESGYRLPSISSLPYIETVDTLGNLKDVPSKGKLVISRNISGTGTIKQGSFSRSPYSAKNGVTGE